jgi:hypothetical protein
MATRSAARIGLPAERRFYVGMAIAVLLTVFAGFAPTFYLKGVLPLPPATRPLTWLIVLHGLVFSAWVLLFLTQVGLVSARRADIHRRLGRLGFALLPAMVVVALLTALGGVARGNAPPGLAPLTWLAVPLIDIPVFTGLIGAALLNRRDPQVHKRFMLVSIIGLMPPSLGRIAVSALPPGLIPFPVVIIGGQLLFLMPLALWDLRSRGRVHWVTATAALVLIGSWVFRLAIWQTHAWLSFAGWAASFAA